MERLRFRPWGKRRQDKGKEGERTVPVDKSLLSPVYPPSCLQLALSTLLLFSCWVMSNSLRPCQAPLSFTISRSLLRFMSIELVMPSNHLILCCTLSSCLQSFPESGSFLMSQFFTSGSQSNGASTLASVLPMNIQDCFFSGLTGVGSFCSPMDSQESSTTPQFKSIIFGTQLSL